MQKFIKDFSLFIKQCYCFARSAEKMQKVKIQLARTKNGRMMLLSKCVVYDSKKLNFVSQQEASELLSSLGIKTPLNKIPLLGPLLF